MVQFFEKMFSGSSAQSSDALQLMFETHKQLNLSDQQFNTFKDIILQQVKNKDISRGLIEAIGGAVESFRLVVVQ